MVSYGKTLANIAGGFFGGRKRRASVSSSLVKRRQKQNAQADVRESVEEIADLRNQLDKLTREHEQGGQGERQNQNCCCGVTGQRNTSPILPLVEQGSATSISLPKC